jgi:hypothetical protein
VIANSIAVANPAPATSHTANVSPLRELENWHARASKHCPDNPLLGVYEQHPLHQPTKWVHGFTMLTAEQRAQWERDWLRELTRAGQDADLLAAA